MGFIGFKSILNLVLGIIILILGIAYYLKWSIAPLPLTILHIILAVGGLILIFDSIIEFSIYPGMAIFNFIIGLLVGIAGILAVLNDVGVKVVVLSFLTIPVLYPIVLVIGLLMVVSAFLF